jgi:hypothetical protein
MMRVERRFRAAREERRYRSAVKPPRRAYCSNAAMVSAMVSTAIVRSSGPAEPRYSPAAALAALIVPGGRARSSCGPGGGDRGESFLTFQDAEAYASDITIDRGRNNLQTAVIFLVDEDEG